ncbi:MAG: hypothetical protein QM784_19640 [Polyangiaceae bacterium]
MGSSRRFIGRVIVRVLLVLVALEALYLGVSNLILGTRLARVTAESAEGLRIAYGRAFSILPGRVHVRSLVLRFEDYNVQFELGIDRARVEVDLLDLFRRRFHVHSVEAAGTAFKFRHKVHSTKKGEARLAAFPPIAGFADPPLYRGEHPPPVADADYELWEVHVENVRAKVNDLWMLEYRFQGNALATGSFTLRPQRWVRVLPGELAIHDGRLSAGPYLLAGKIAGTVQCSIPGLDVRASSGMQVFKGISGEVNLDLQNGTIDATRLYTEPYLNVVASGPLEAKVRARLSNGVVTPKTRIDLSSNDLEVGRPPVTIRGTWSARLINEEPAVEPRIEAVFERGSLSYLNGTTKAPRIDRAATTLQLESLDVTRRIEWGQSHSLPTSTCRTYRPWRYCSLPTVCSTFEERVTVTSKPSFIRPAPARPPLKCESKMGNGPPRTSR